VTEDDDDHDHEDDQESKNRKKIKTVDPLLDHEKLDVDCVELG
jgi:hypothetical protein